MTDTGDRERQRLRRAAPAVAGLFVLLSVVYTWPLLATAGSRIAADPRDPVLNAAVLAWNAMTVPLSRAWWDAPHLYPATGVTTFTEPLLGQSILATPVIWLTGDPVLAYNVALFLTFPLSAFAAFVLAWALTKRIDAAVVAGLCFGFAPYRLGQLSHLQVLSAYWLPVALVALHQFLDDRRARWLVLFGAAWVLQSLSNLYFMLFGAVLIALWIAYFGSAPGRRRLVPAILGVWLVSSLLLTPLLLGYIEVHAQYGLTRGLPEIVPFGADPSAWLRAPADHWLAPVLRTSLDELSLYPGLTAVIGVALALALTRTWGTRPRDAFMFYVGATIVMAVLACGPELRIGSTVLMDSAPYRWLMWLPGFDGLRVPARFWMLGALCLAVAAALAFDRLAPADGRRRRWWLAVVAAGLLVDAWPRVFPTSAAPDRWPAPAESAVASVLELPLDHDADVAAMLRAAMGGYRTVNGATGYEPRHYALLRVGVNDRDPAVLTALASFGPLEVVVNPVADRDGSLARYVLGVPGATRQPDWGGRARVRLAPPLPDPAPGRVIAIADIRASAADAAVAIDGRPDTGWVSPSQHVDQWLVLDLGATVDVAMLEHDVGPDVNGYPRRLAVDVSSDGETWQTVWNASTVAAAMLGALQDPPRMPMRLVFQPTAARFIRLRQFGQSPHAWQVAELRVYAPR